MKLKPLFDLRLIQGYPVPLKMVQTKYERAHILFSLVFWNGLFIPGKDYNLLS